MASVVNRSVSALSFLLQLIGCGDVTKEFVVRQVIRGFQKGVVVRDSRRPVSFNILEVLCSKLGTLCMSPFEELLFKLSFSLAFYGPFRVR